MCRAVPLWMLMGTLALLLAGCTFGPRAIERTHGPYAAAIQKVDEEQFLLNIIRLRYSESPLSLDVTSIASQYELDVSAEARPFFSTEGNSGVFPSFSAILPFGGLRTSNRPTISLAPSDDAAAVRQFLMPITAETLMMLGQSGWPVSSILRIWVDRLNGVPNLEIPGRPEGESSADSARFMQVCQLMQAAQDLELLSVHAKEHIVELSSPLKSEAVTASAIVDAARNGFEYLRSDNCETWTLVRRQKSLVLSVNPAGQDSPELAEIRQILNLAPEIEEYQLVEAGGVPDPARSRTEPSTTLRIAPRSSARAMIYLSNGVDVPEEHLLQGVARTAAGRDALVATDGLFQIRSCKGHRFRPPACAYASVWYRDHWYYIDDRDQTSKATLLLMLQLRRLDFQRQPAGAAPLLTIPVGS